MQLLQLQLDTFMHVWMACMNSIHKNPLSYWTMLNISSICIKLCLAHCSSICANYNPMVMSLAGPVQAAWHAHNHVGIEHLSLIYMHYCYISWRINLVPPYLCYINLTLPPSCTIVFMQTVAIIHKMLKYRPLYSCSNKYYAWRNRHDILFIILYPSWGDQQLNYNSS